MKIKCRFLTVLFLTVTFAGFAQAQKPVSKKPAAITPGQLVANLYAAQKTEKTNPFAQIKSRVLVDKYFTKDLADLIWQTNTAPDDGWRHIDVLYDSDEQLRDSQDPQITNLAFGKPVEDSGPNDVFLSVTFRNHGVAKRVDFNLRRDETKTWKIDDIVYSNFDDLSHMLRYKTDVEYKEGYDANPFPGEYTVGSTQCSVVQTMGSHEFYRVTCDGQEGFKIYGVEGDEKQTSYISVDDKGKDQGKFVFKAGENDGKYFDAAGKEVKVKRVSPPVVAAPVNPESETVSGELIFGKTESVILYTGMETGDYAAYCFSNVSEAGRAILAACKKGDQCELGATLGDVGSKRCKVPGLEASLSAEFRITKVASVKSLGRRK